MPKEGIPNSCEAGGLPRSHGLNLTISLQSAFHSKIHPNWRSDFLQGLRIFYLATEAVKHGQSGRMATQCRFAGGEWSR